MALTLTRPTLTFELAASGIVVIVQQPTRGQIREAYALDPGERTDPMSSDEQRIAQLAILLRDGDAKDVDGNPLGMGDVLAQLSPTEEIDMLNALVAWCNGLDPENAVELQAGLRALLQKKKARR